MHRLTGTIYTSINV